MRNILLAIGLAAWASAAPAQQVVLGAGYADFANDVSLDRAVLAIEYHHDPFLTRDRFTLGLGAALSVHATGDFFAGIGLAAVYDLKGRWFIEASVMPGIFEESTPLNDLGSAFEIRSLIGVGYELDDNQAVSLAITHKSNASTSNHNPGVDAILLRWHHRF